MSFSATLRSSMGFTLIELLAVLALIAILSAFVVPSITISHSDERNDVLGIVNAALENARNSATLQRKRHELVFFKNGVQLMPDGQLVFFPESMSLVEFELEGDDERMSDDFPVSLPFHQRGNTMPARMVFDDSSRADSLVLLITPFGFTAEVEE